MFAREPLLSIRDLRVCFDTEDGIVRAVDGVSLHVNTGETLGLVGESGCGKSVTAYSILRLLPAPPARYAGGSILFEGTDLLRASESEMRRTRGASISIIFQEPMSSLNPIMKVGRQVSEALLAHGAVEKSNARPAAVEMLRRAGIPSPESTYGSYPHQLSGGMKQRVMIAIALACRPKLLVADEPTTALDVTIQAQILGLLDQLKREFDMSMLLITHDLGVVAETCDRVAVMYAGRIVESAGVDELFTTPAHPYTLGLFNSLPSLERSRGKLEVIPGSVPSLVDLPPGCRFRPRCSFARDECLNDPELREIGSGHHVACHFAEEILDRFEA